MTAEQKRARSEKVALAKRGKKYPKASAATTKLWQNPEFRKKCSDAQKGKKVIHSAETRAKISAILKEVYKDKTKTSNWKGGISKANGYKRRKKLERAMAIVGSHTELEWQALIKEYEYKCLGCGKPEGEVKLTKDHIVPVSRGGTDNIDNIQPLCISCNCRKHTKTIDYRYN
jgi:5-methylcytosine-specific restriction endonuclease McrA